MGIKDMKLKDNKAQTDGLRSMKRPTRENAVCVCPG